MALPYKHSVSRKTLHASLPKQTGNDQKYDPELDGSFVLGNLDKTTWDFAQAKR